MLSQFLTAFTRTPFPTSDNMIRLNTPNRTMLHMNGADSIIRVQASPYNRSRSLNKSLLVLLGLLFFLFLLLLLSLGLLFRSLAVVLSLLRLLFCNR